MRATTDAAVLRCSYWYDVMPMIVEGVRDSAASERSLLLAVAASLLHADSSLLLPSRTRQGRRRAVGGCCDDACATTGERANVDLLLLLRWCVGCALVVV